MLAWPSVLTMLLQTLNSFTDRFFVGHLGSDALAAVGVGGQFMFLLFSVGMSISVGTSALVARFTGAKEPDQATLAANQSVWIGFLSALRLHGAGLAAAPPGRRLDGGQSRTRRPCASSTSPSPCSASPRCS